MKQQLLLGFIFISNIISAQHVEISGQVESAVNTENIHVINKTSKQFTITDKNGHFKISAKLNDTLTFSSIQHKFKELVVSKEIFTSKTIYVTLEEQVNELDEVVVGKILTGDLLTDIINVEGKPPINFFDVGIPGYTGKPATQTERKFNEATTGPNGQRLKWYSPLTGSIPLNPILNAISGRTKMLKKRVEQDERENLMRQVKSRLAKDFFASNPLEENLRNDFFYFCADDENFIKYCKTKTDFEILIFLRMKYRQYKENMATPRN